MLGFANVLDLRKGSASSFSFKTALLFHLHFPHLVSVVAWMDHGCLDLSLVFGYCEELRLLRRVLEEPVTVTAPCGPLPPPCCFPRVEQPGWDAGEPQGWGIAEIRGDALLSPTS